MEFDPKQLPSSSFFQETTRSPSPGTSCRSTGPGHFKSCPVFAKFATKPSMASHLKKDMLLYFQNYLQNLQAVGFKKESCSTKKTSAVYEKKRAWRRFFCSSPSSCRALDNMGSDFKTRGHATTCRGWRQLGSWSRAIRMIWNHQKSYPDCKYQPSNWTLFSMCFVMSILHKVELKKHPQFDSYWGHAR